MFIQVSPTNQGTPSKQHITQRTPSDRLTHQNTPSKQSTSQNTPSKQSTTQNTPPEQSTHQNASSKHSTKNLKKTNVRNKIPFLCLYRRAGWSMRRFRYILLVTTEQSRQFSLSISYLRHARSRKVFHSSGTYGPREKAQSTEFTPAANAVLTFFRCRV